ncbi:MAG: hypothetical protein ACW986_12530 [Promethearchaeota archaeon]|jgi:hypothetical protein
MERKNKSRIGIKELIIAKRICDALIFLSLAMIFSSIFIFIYIEMAPSNPHLNGIQAIFPPPDPPYAPGYFQTILFLGFIPPSLIAVLIIIPLRIIVGNRLKILITPQRNHDSEQNRKALKMRMYQDFLFQNYRGLYYKTSAPKKFQL